MPFDYQSNKISRTLSLRSLRRRSTGGSTTPVSSGSTFGDQLCKQLDTHLRLHSGGTAAPSEPLTRSQSLSSQLMKGLENKAQNKRGDDKRQLPHLYSLNGPDPAPSPQTSAGHTNSHLDRKSSSSSSHSFRSAQSAESSPASSFCQVPTLKTAAVNKRVEGEGWSEFLKTRLGSIITPQSPCVVEGELAHKTGRSGLRSKFHVFRSNKSKALEAGTHYQLRRDKKTNPVNPILEKSALYELTEPLSKEFFIAPSTTDQSKDSVPAPPSSLRVKFDVNTHVVERDSFRPVVTGQPSIKRSLSVSSSLDTIPEDMSKICLLSPTGMTL